MNITIIYITMILEINNNYCINVWSAIGIFNHFQNCTIFSKQEINVCWLAERKVVRNQDCRILFSSFHSSTIFAGHSPFFPPIYISVLKSVFHVVCVSLWTGQTGWWKNKTENTYTEGGRETMCLTSHKRTALITNMVLLSHINVWISFSLSLCQYDKDRERRRKYQRDNERSRKQKVWGHRLV